MVRVMNVAEKPRVAKAIAQAISGGGHLNSRTGHTNYHPIYSCRYMVDGQQCDMQITSVRGHLKNLEFPDRWSRWKACDPRDLFDAPVESVVSEDNVDIQRNLHDLARNSDCLILWLDCDREGEAISYEVIEEVQRVNRRIRIRRAIFSELTPRAIHRALRTLGEPNPRDAQAVQARQEIDLRLGSAFTRFLTMHLKDRFKDLPRLVSYGPCQFPTLGFVVDRYLLREQFIPEDIYTINMTYSHGGNVAKFKWKRGSVTDRLACTLYYEMCVDAQQAQVQKVIKQEVTKPQPVPLTTVQLQILASRKLNLSAHDAMAKAESLYQRGYLSYPRTETDKFTADTDLHALIAVQHTNPVWGPYALQLTQGGKFNPPRDGGHNDNSHPPIHPTKPLDAAVGDVKERELYELVARHFLACCSKPAEGARTTVTASMDSEVFTAYGLMIYNFNYLDIYKYETWTGNTLPVLHEGNHFIPSSLDFNQSRTQAPPKLKEADLVKIMDNEGIGTDATIAEHISTIQNREYAHKDPVTSEITPTPLGIALISGYNSIGYQMCSPNLRAQIESDMKGISHGTTTKEVVVHDCIQTMRKVYDDSVQQVYKIERAIQEHFERASVDATFTKLASPFTACGNCGGEVRLDLYSKPNDRGIPEHFLSCPQCQVHLPLPKGKEFIPKEHICPLCQFQTITWITSNDKRVSMCPSCNHQAPPGVGDAHTTQFLCFRCPNADCPLSPDTSLSAAVCPDCGKNQVVKTAGVNKSWVLSCTGYPQCRRSTWLNCVSKADTRQDTCPQCGPRHHIVDLTIRHSSLSFEVLPDFSDLSTLRVCFGGHDQQLRKLLGNDADKAFQATAPRGRGRGQQQPPHAGGVGMGIGRGGGRGGGGRGGRGRGGSSHAFLSQSFDVLHQGLDPRGGRGGGQRENINRNGLVCFNCQQTGHYANECPQKKTYQPRQQQQQQQQQQRIGPPAARGARGGTQAGRGGAPHASARKCSICRQPGHTKTRCPQVQQ